MGSVCWYCQDGTPTGLVQDPPACDDCADDLRACAARMQTSAPPDSTTPLESEAA